MDAILSDTLDATWHLTLSCSTQGYLEHPQYRGVDPGQEHVELQRKKQMRHSQRFLHTNDSMHPGVAADECGDTGHPGADRATAPFDASRQTSRPPPAEISFAQLVTYLPE